MWLILWRKTVFVNIYHALYKISCLQLILISCEFTPFLTCWEKQTFQVFLSFFLRESIFLLKREVFSKYSRKRFKTTGKNCLAVLAHFEENFFFVNICLLLLVWSKELFKQIQILLWICLFKLVKKNKLSVYFCGPFWDSHFLD